MANERNEDVLAFGRAILNDEARALAALADDLGRPFEDAVQLVLNCTGKIIVSGLGKSGHVARKIAATFASTGTTATFLHLAEAIHGDLGMTSSGDVAILISQSGETAELEPVIDHFREGHIPIVAITGNSGSMLAEAATASMILPHWPEVGPESVAPTTSTTMTLALGDALAMTVMRQKGFSRSDFGRLHPGGALGARLRPIRRVMHKGDSLPLTNATTSMHDTVLEMSAKRLGIVGVALTAVGEAGKPIVSGVESLVKVMLRVTDYVMRFAPLAVFTAVTGAIAAQGPQIILTFGKFVGAFYLGLILLWAILIGAAYVIVGPRTKHLVRYVRDPVVVAFSTASSEAAYPRTLEALDRFGVPPRIASFVLPLGYSFNLDGSMMYMTFASMFIAQAYGMHLSIGQQIGMLLVLMITSKGLAGVPRASIVILAATLPMFGIPAAGLLLILAVDHFLDMGRSATNVVGNAVAASVIACWEGGLDRLEPSDIDLPRSRGTLEQDRVDHL